MAKARTKAKPNPRNKKLYDDGMKMRKAVLGAAYVDNSMANADDFMMSFQDITTEYCWGYAWTRPGLPKKTRSTPSTANSLLARCDVPAVSALAKSNVPLSITTRPGRNFSVDGLGVCSVWINKPYLLTRTFGVLANRRAAQGWGRDVAAPSSCPRT